MKIVHRDISINNIMIYHAEDDEPRPSLTLDVALHKGLLIDFDYTMYLDQENAFTSPGD